MSYADEKILSVKLLKFIVLSFRSRRWLGTSAITMHSCSSCEEKVTIIYIYMTQFVTSKSQKSSHRKNILHFRGVEISSGLEECVLDNAVVCKNIF
jgi:hypothetical protein